MKKFAKFQKNETRTTVDDGQSRLLLTLDRSSIRVAILIIPTMVVAFLLITGLSKMFIPAFAEPLARHIAREIGNRPLNGFETLKIIRHYNLAWCYVTDANDIIMPATAAFAPPTRRVPQRSQSLTIRDQSFYESVVPLSPGRYLHIGLSQGEWFSLPKLNGDSFVAFLYAPLPIGALLALLVVTWLVVFLLMESVIGLSMRLLGGSIDRMSSLVDTNFTEAEIKESTEQKFVPQDFRALGLSLAFLMRKVLEVKEKSKAEASSKWNRRKVFQTTETRAIASEERKRTDEYSSVESGVFAVKFDRELGSAESSYDFAVRLLDGVHETYSDVVDFASFLKIDRDQAIQVETCLHLDDDSANLLKMVNYRELLDERNITKKSIDIGPMLIKKLGFEDLANKDGIGRIIYLPFYHDGRAFGFLAIFIKKDHTVSSERLKSLERFRDKALSLYYDHRMREERDDDRWTDRITGMGNKTFFQELMPRVMSRAKIKGDNGKFSFLLIAPEFSTPDLARFPAEMHDRWFAEIGQLITGLLPVSRRLVPERAAPNYLIRYQEHMVAIILEGISVTAAVNVAEGIRNSVANKAHWTGGASGLIVSAGVATFPRDGNTAEEIISRSAITLAYVREKLGGNTVIDCRQVPPSFKPKEATEIAGTLGVLDCAGLLQSIATSSNTGILIVENELGEQFFISWVDGEPRQATLGDLTGVDAVIEFITTFKNGQYTFQQRAATDGPSPSDLHSLEHCLMESALAEDKMNVALRVIPNVDARIARLDNANAWGLLSQDREITPKEVEALRAVYSQADGVAPLSSIFDQLSHIPTAVKWRASGLLIQYNLVNLVTG